MKENNPKKGTAPLATVSKFIYSAMCCERLYYLLNQRRQTELCSLLAIRILIVKSCMRWRGIMIKGLSQDGGRAKFAENLQASPFDHLSNESTFK